MCVRVEGSSFECSLCGAEPLASCGLKNIQAQASEPTNEWHPKPGWLLEHVRVTQTTNDLRKAASYIANAMNGSPNASLWTAHELARAILADIESRLREG